MKVKSSILVGSVLWVGHGLGLAEAVQPKQVGWEIGGTIQLEGVYRHPDEGDRAAGVGVGQAELVVEAELNDWIGAGATLLYEEEDIGLEEAEQVALDSASLTIGPPEGSWFFSAGQQYVPFANWPPALISDPLTLQLGETNELALQLGLSSGGLHGSIFGFYGDEDQNGGYGAAIGYLLERGEAEFGLNLSYISDIGVSGALQEVIADTRGRHSVPGWTARTELRYANAVLTGEYLASLGHFVAREVEYAGRGAQPSSWLLEAACAVRLAGREVTVVVGYQGTEEARALKLPTRRLLAGLSVELATWFSPALEWARDEDYANQQVSTTTVQLAVAF